MWHAESDAAGPPHRLADCRHRRGPRNLRLPVEVAGKPAMTIVVALVVGCFTLAGGVAGAAITDGIQLRLAARAEEQAMRTAKREVSAEVYEAGIAARVVFARPELTDDYLHLLGRSELWDKNAHLLAGDECYLSVRLAYFSADATARALDRGDRFQAEQKANDAYDDARRALEAIGNIGGKAIQQMREVAAKATELKLKQAASP
jgi:hypothetical protein